MTTPPGPSQRSWPCASLAYPLYQPRTPRTRSAMAAMRTLMTAPIRGAQCRAELLSKLLRLKSDRGIFTRQHSALAYLLGGGPWPKTLIRVEGAYPFCVRSSVDLSNACLIVPNSPTPLVSDGNRLVVSHVLIVSYQTVVPAVLLNRRVQIRGISYHVLR